MSTTAKPDDAAAAAAAAPAAAPTPTPTMRRNDVSMTDMSDMDTGDNLYHVRKSRLIRLINWWQVRGPVLITSTAVQQQTAVVLCYTAVLYARVSISHLLLSYVVL